MLTNALEVSLLYRLRWGTSCGSLRDHLKHSPGHCHAMSNVNRMLPQLARNIEYSVLQNQSPPEHGRTHMSTPEAQTGGLSSKASLVQARCYSNAKGLREWSDVY